MFRLLNPFKFGENIREKEITATIILTPFDTNVMDAVYICVRRTGYYSSATFSLHHTGVKHSNERMNDKKDTMRTRIICTLSDHQPWVVLLSNVEN